MMTTWLRLILTTPILPLLLLAAVPDPARAELSPEWKAALTDDAEPHKAGIRLTEASYRVDDAVEIFAWIRNRDTLKGRGWYFSWLTQGIIKDFDSYDALKVFVSSMPDSSRPLPSWLLSSYFQIKKQEPSDLEFQECESKLIDDIVLFFRDDPEVTDEYFMLVSAYDYFTNSNIWRHHQPADPNRSFSLLYDLFCRTRSGVLATDFATSIVTLQNPEAPALLAKEICGEGCRDSLINTTRRKVVDALIRTPEGREVAAEILPKITDEKSFQMLLGSCKSKPAFTEDIDFCMTVFQSYENWCDRLGVTRQAAREGLPRVWSKSSLQGSILAFNRRAWPTLTERMLNNPEDLRPYAELIGTHINSDSILSFAARSGKQIQEPFLSVLAYQVCRSRDHPSIRKMLDCVGEERLSDEVREIALSELNRRWIPMRPAVERKKTRIDRRRR